MSVHAFWIPILDGEKQCFCCGIWRGGVTLPCGDHYCQICEGRGHEEDHTEDECAHGAGSPTFHRLDEDCPACRMRHSDWETCRDMISDYARRDGRRPDLTDRFVIHDGVVAEGDE